MFKLKLGGAVASLVCACTLVSSALAGAYGLPGQPPQVTLPASGSSSSSSGSLPGADDVAEALRGVAREESARERALREPQTVEAREASRLLYAGDDSIAEAVGLLRSVFGQQLATMNQDPGRFLSNATLEKKLGPAEARVSSDGETSLLEAGVPVEARDDQGNLEKVDLTLEPVGGGYAPSNPLVDVVVPTSLDEGVSVGSGPTEVVIRTAGPSDSRGNPFGVQNAVYADVQTDRDLLVSPVARGVELSDQLRSAASPEDLRYDLEMPPDSELVSDGNGGAKVIRGQATLVRIPFPTAVDAQGSEVSVRLEVDGDAVVLHVPHRDRSIAYPVLVDPVFELAESWYWYNGWDLQGLSDGSWQWGSNVGWIYGSTSCIYACWGSGRGLFVSTPNAAFYGDQFGQWTYTPPGQTSYVTGATLNPFWRDNHGCSKSKAPEPHDYDGIWSPSGWNAFEGNRANDYGNAQLSAGGRVLVVGLGTGTGGSNACWRDIMLAGVSVWITDPDNPSWNGSPTVAGTWTDTAVQPISVSASDPGLGVKYFNLFTTDGAGNPAAFVGNAVHPCTGLHASPCPASWSTQISNYNPAALANGINPMALRAYDPLPDSHYAGQAVFLKVDHSAPVVKTSGELLAQHPTKYHLEVNAEDGSAATFASAQSGMKKVEFFLDGEYKGIYPEPNPPNCSKIDQGIDVGSCKFEGIDLDLPRWLEGKHALKILATDSLGHPTTETLNLDLPSDDTGPELTVSGLLRSASWMAATETTTTVAAKDLETGVAEAAVFIDGEEVGQVEQDCEYGGCELDHTFSVSLVGYEKGPHSVKVVATDVAGNSTQISWIVNVDSQAPALNITTTPGIPAGWAPQLTSLSISATATDNGGAVNGSGITKIEAIRPLAGESQSPVTLYSSTCGSAESPCSQEITATKALTPFILLRQGTIAVPIKAYDVAGNVTTKSITLHIDRNPPQISATGPLVEAPAGSLVGAGSKLDLSIADKGSGVAAVELLLDGNLEQTLTLEEIEADGGSQSCSGETCTLTYSFHPEIGASLPAGDHTLLIRAKDRAERAGTLTRTVTLDTRAPALVLSGPLAESAGQELPGVSAQLEIDAVDADGVLPRSGVDVIELSVDGELVASFANCSGGVCAEPAEWTYTYDEAEWGTGPHEVGVVAFDRAGNAVVERLMVNGSINAVAPTCPTREPTVLPSADSVSPTEATAAIETDLPQAVAPSEAPPPGEGEAPDESPFDPSVEEEGPTSINEQGIDVVGAPTGGGLENEAAGSFTVGQAVCLRPLQTTSAASTPVVAGGDAVIYANSAPATDTVIRPTAFGTTVIQHRRGSSAPDQFSWEVGLAPGEELQQLSNGTIAVVRAAGNDFSEIEIPSEAGTSDPLDIADVDTQIARMGANFAEANNEVEGKVVAVIAVPTVVKADKSTSSAQLKISGGKIVVATLPPSIVAETVAMIIEANTSPDPVAMCAHVFSDTPNLYSDGCVEPNDPSSEPPPSADEGVKYSDLELKALSPQLRAEFAESLDSWAGATASAPGSGTEAASPDEDWCYSNIKRSVYCAFFEEDKDYAVSMEARLFNIDESDSTKGNAFRHALWVSAMINSGTPDIAALNFARNHEKDQENSPYRRTRYKSYMDNLNNFSAWVYARFAGLSDLQACNHWVSKVGPAIFIGYAQNPSAWANKVQFAHRSLVYRRKYENGILVHLDSQNCG